MPDTITRLGAIYEDGMKAMKLAMEAAKKPPVAAPVAKSATGETPALPMQGAIPGPPPSNNGDNG